MKYKFLKITIFSILIISPFLFGNLVHAQVAVAGSGTISYYTPNPSGFCDGWTLLDTGCKARSISCGSQSGTLCVPGAGVNIGCGPSAGCISGAQVIQGSGTKFTAEIQVGDTINITNTGESRYVQAITSDTYLTVTATFTGLGGNATNQAYTITHPSCNESATVSLSNLPAVMTPGQVAPFTVSVTNNGNTLWYNSLLFQLVQISSPLLSISPTSGDYSTSTTGLPRTQTGAGLVSNYGTQCNTPIATHDSNVCGFVNLDCATVGSGFLCVPNAGSLVPSGNPDQPNCGKQSMCQQMTQTITGVFTHFLTQAHVGDTITIGSETETIASINSDTSLTTVAPFANGYTNTSYQLTNSNVYVNDSRTLNFNLTAPTTPGQYTLSMQNVRQASVIPKLNNGGPCSYSNSSPYAFGDTGTASFTVVGNAVNGACGLTHYLCSSGTSVNNVNGASSYTWDCDGTGGGTNKIGCTEPKEVSTAGLSVPSGTTVQTGNSIKVTWTNVSNTSQNNELRLFIWDDVDQTYVYTSPSEYLSSSGSGSCSVPPTTSAPASGACLFTIPLSALSGAASGTFEFVLAPIGSSYSTTVATSITFTVTAPAKPDLIVVPASLAPTSAVIGTSQTFTAQIKNNSVVATGSSFSNMMQVSTLTAAQITAQLAANPSNLNTISSIGASSNPTGGLAAGVSASITAYWIFNGPASPPTQSIRACADENTLMVGTVDESNESNNCSPWTDVTVTAVPVMSGILSSSPNPCTIGAGGSTCATVLSWSVTNPENKGGSVITSNINDVGNPSTGFTVATGDLSTQSSVSVPYNNGVGRTFYLYNNNKSLFPSSPSGTGVDVIAVCDSGTSWDSVSNTCKTASAPTTTSITANGSSVQAGNSISVSWTDTLTTGTSSDQIRLYSGASSKGSYYAVSPTCSSTLGAFASSGTCLYLIPLSTPSGSYNFQLWPTSGLSVKLATSNAFTVIAAPAPDLTSGVVSPTTATVAVAKTYTATISNVGTLSTGTSFPYFFQTNNAASGRGKTTVDYPSSTMTALAANRTGTATSPSITFASPGTYSIRVCADKTSSAGGGVITESNENNNCGVWTNVVVSGGTSLAPDLTADPVTQTTAIVGVAQSYTATIHNVGNVSTGTSFPYFFQTSTNGGTTATDYANSTMNVLNGGASGLATSPSIALSPAGIYSVRVCANKTDSSHFGTVTESDNSNNCGAWTSVMVSAPSLSVSISASPNPVPLAKKGDIGSTTLTWMTTGSPTNCIASGNWSGNLSVYGGSKQITGLAQGTYTYSITCSKPGASQTSPVTVIVGTAGSIGKCPSPQVHFNCASGAPSNEVSSPSKWTWTCAGTTSSASCVEKTTPGYKEN